MIKKTILCRVLLYSMNSNMVSKNVKTTLIVRKELKLTETQVWSFNHFKRRMEPT